MKLRTIAHSRSGDKGTIVNVSLIAFEPRQYPLLVHYVTAARVKSHFADLATGEVALKTGTERQQRYDTTASSNSS